MTSQGLTPRGRRVTLSFLLVLAATLPGLGCRREAPSPPRLGQAGADEPPAALAGLGDPQRGAEAMERHGCGACHRIPGVRGARGLVGPSLAEFGRRSYIAGALENTPLNVARWVRDPQTIEPGTVMPRLGVTEQEAQDIAAHLSALK